MSTGCKLKAPLNATKLEIGGEMVYGVLEAWKDAWYKFEVESDNTPFILIFKNMGNADSAWLGYQINWYYKNKGDLVLLNSVQVEPTGPADPENITIEDKTRIFNIAPYKGTYYIRIYGYAQPVSENKKYELPYMIGLAKPETYSDADNISAGASQEVNVVGDILSIYKLGIGAGGVYNIKIESTLDPNIVDSINVLESLLIQLRKVNADGDVSVLQQWSGPGDDIKYTYITHSSDTNAYYVVLQNVDEFGNVKVKVSLQQVSVASISPSKVAVSVKGEEVKAYKLNVSAEKSYFITIENLTGGVYYSLLEVSPNGTISNLSSPFYVPKDNKDEYYLLLKGSSKKTDASGSITFNEGTITTTTSTP